MSLEGKLRAIPGILVAARAAKRLGFNKIFVPKVMPPKRPLVPDVEVYAPDSLTTLLNHLSGRVLPVEVPTPIGDFDGSTSEADLAHIYGQEQAKRALVRPLVDTMFYLRTARVKQYLPKSLVSILPSLSRPEVLK